MMTSTRWRLVAFALLLGLGVVGVAIAVWRFAPEPVPLTSVAGVDGRLNQLRRELSGQSIVGLELEVTVDASHGGLRVQAQIQAESREAGRRRFAFLLNPGFTVTAVEVHDRPARFIWSQGRLSVTMPDPVASREIVPITVHYQGVPDDRVLRAPSFTDSSCILPSLAFWHPFDLQSFFTVSMTVHVPEGWEVASPRTAASLANADGSVTVSWQEERPVFGVPLAAGRFTDQSRIRGATYTTLYAPEGLHDAAVLLDRASRSYRALTELLGDDGFGHLQVVVSPDASRPFYAGGSTVVIPLASVNRVQSGTEYFMAVATPAARIWWEGTVSGRWLADPAEGGAWLAQGMADYSAWVALNDEYGRHAFLRHIEQTPPPDVEASPLKTLSMTASVHADSVGPGPFLARMLASYVGESRFHEGIQRFVAVHRHGFVSLVSFRQEIELAAAVGLGEFFHAWFDRPAQFDYALEDIEELDGGRAVITIANRSQTPFAGEMALAIGASNEVAVHRIEAGARGGRFVLPYSGRLESVALDPFFETPDTIRANTIWPRRTWPRGVTASINNEIAWWSFREWNPPGYTDISILEADGRTVRVVRLTDAPVDAPSWSPDGSKLAWTRSGSNGVPTLHVHATDTASEARIPNAGRFIGWLDNEQVLTTRRDESARWMIIHVESRRTIAAWEAPEPIGVPAVHPKGPLLAYATVPNHRLMVVDSTTEERTAFASSFEPSGPMSWNAEGNRLVYFDREKGLQRIDPAHPNREPDTLIALRYAVHDAQFAPDRRQVGWRDSAGFLRVSSLEQPEALHVPLRGELVDWSWQGSDTLVCLTVDSPPQLPMRFHGNYALWRIPVDTLEPERLPLDPSRR